MNLRSRVCWCLQSVMKCDWCVFLYIRISGVFAYFHWDLLHFRNYIHFFSLKCFLEKHKVWWKHKSMLIVLQNESNIGYGESLVKCCGVRCKTAGCLFCDCLYFVQTFFCSSIHPCVCSVIAWVCVCLFAHHFISIHLFVNHCYTCLFSLSFF